MITIIFFPELVFMMWIIGKIFESRAQIPEDIDEQVKLSN